MQADFAASTVRLQRLIRLQWQIGYDLGQEYPGTPAFGEDIRIFSIPAQPRAPGYRTINHAPRIDEETCLRLFAHLLVCVRAQPPRELLEFWLDNFMIIVAPGIA